MFGAKRLSLTNLINGGMFYGWRIVLVLSLMRFVASGVGMNARSLLLLPLEKDLGVTRAEISLMFTVESLVIAATAPLGGWLMDRYGARRVMVAGLWFLLAVSSCCPLLNRCGRLSSLSRYRLVWPTTGRF